MLNLVPFNEEYFQQSGMWLKDFELKRLIDAPDTPEEDRVEWFRSLPSKKDYFIWGVALDDAPIGVVGLKNVTECAGEYFGYIGNAGFRGRGHGRMMLDLVERELVSLDINTIYLKVIFENYIAINLYFKSGYRITDVVNGRLYRMEKANIKSDKAH